MLFAFARRASRRRGPNERGATSVEFAFVLPVLLWLMFNAIDGGRLIVARLMLSYASVAGARVAAVSSTTTVGQVQSAVVAAAPLLGLTTGAVTVTGFATRAPGATVSVSINYSYARWTPSIFTARTWAVNSGPFIVE